MSAMIVAAQLGSPLSAAQPSAEQLGLIAEYLSVNDVQGLRDYITSNPSLTEGDTTLARLLRDFLAESADVTTYLGFKPGLSESFSGLEDGPTGGFDETTAAISPSEPAY